ncbi:MAG: c-type cytochrome [Rubrimonas sp.]
MKTAAFAVVIAAMAAPAFADVVEDSIRARRGFFTMLGMGVEPLGAMARGEAEYDAGVAQGHADDLAALAGYRFGALFVEGSSNADRAGETRALPAIWSNADDFQAKAADLIQAIAGVQAAAPEGRAAMGAALGTLGGTCRACHQSYRAQNF